MSTVKITDLVIYPVKSMRGIAVQQSVLEAEGLAHDRRYMVVRGNGRFVTQRDMPRLSQIHTAFEKHGILLSAPGAEGILVPIEREEGEQIHSEVWGDQCNTIDQGHEISRWLTDALQSDETLRLVCMQPGYARPQSQPELLGADTHTYFADAAPFLVANESSLRALNQELSGRGHEQVPMNRFRPNIIVEGLSPFDEHQLSSLQHTNYSLNFTHPCQRCVVTTIDQETGVKNRDWQPYRTLCEINPMPGKERAPAFAHNATLAHGQGVLIAVGDLLNTQG